MAYYVADNDHSRAEDTYSMVELFLDTICSTWSRWWRPEDIRFMAGIYDDLALWTNSGLTKLQQVVQHQLLVVIAGRFVQF